MAEWKKERSRLWNVLLYPDDPTHADALDKIRSGDYEYVMVLHNCDTNPETGELKKEHYHVILRFTNAVYNAALCKDLGIEINYLQKTKSWKDSAVYLLHFGKEDKYQYPADALEGTLVDQVLKIMSGKNEKDGILALMDWIDEQPGFISTAQLNREACRRDLWDVCRRSGVFLLRTLDEHNQQVNASCRASSA